MLHQITEDTKHASLECGMGITQAKGHPPVGICAKWADEGGLLLVFYCNLNLEVAWITIQEAVKGLAGNSFEKLVHEG